MTDLFPFNLPASTSLYLILFVATLVIHFIFMSYVVAGSIWVLASQFAAKGRASEITVILKDWMPVMLSGAITAGVAPLLFIQILYRQQFYTANLLQFHRWMMILPILIVLFYLTYLIKAQGDRRSWIQKTAAAVCVGCVLFIGWSWSGNHILSLQGHDAWQQHYAGNGLLPQQEITVGVRLSLWIALTFPVLGCLLTWQLRGRTIGIAAQPPGVALTSAIAIGGTITSPILAILLVSRMSADIRTAIVSGPSLVWVTAAALGTILQLGAWVQRSRSRCDTFATRVTTTFGIIMQLVGVMMCREVIRVASLADRIDFAGHADAATSGGFQLFLAFCLVNGITAAWCVRLATRRSVRLHSRSDRMPHQFARVKLREVAHPRQPEAEQSIISAQLAVSPAGHRSSFDS